MRHHTRSRANPKARGRRVRYASWVRCVRTRRGGAGELIEMNGRLAADPNDVEALTHRGWLRFNLTQPAEAVADLERAVKLRPDDKDALFLLSQAYSQTNNLPAARAALETYPEQCPDDIDARVKKGQMAFRLDRLSEAAVEFSRVLEADPSRNPVRARRAKILLRLGRFTEALADLDISINRYPKDPDLPELRGQAHDGLGDKERANSDRKRAAELPRADAGIYNNRAWTLATGPAVLRDHDEALTAARKAVALRPNRLSTSTRWASPSSVPACIPRRSTPWRKVSRPSKGQSDAFDLFFLAMARRKLGQVCAAAALISTAPSTAPRPSQPVAVWVERGAGQFPGRGRGGPRRSRGQVAC